MRGEPDPQLTMLTALSTEELIPADHPIRRVRTVVDAVLAELDEVFEGMYAAGVLASGPPETLLKSTVLMAMYSIRSEWRSANGSTTTAVQVVPGHTDRSHGVRRGHVHQTLEPQDVTRSGAMVLSS